MIEESKQPPLVSIIVITYNSSKYVLETLESAKAQTYRNIELIVSDDCSTDDTVSVCNNWLLANNERFVRIKMLTSIKNTGISANINRGCRESKGQFLKPIAGDDCLDSTIIEVYVSYLIINPQVSMVFSDVCFIDSNGTKGQVSKHDLENSQITFDRQFQQNIFYSPTILFTKDIYIKVNGYDESLNIEDIDFYLNILLTGGVIHYIKGPVILYRIHDSNINNNFTFMLQGYLQTLHKYRRLHPNYKKNYLKFSKGILYHYKLTKKFGFFEAYKILSKDDSFLILIFFDLFYWIKYFFKIPIKNLINNIRFKFSQI